MLIPGWVETEEITAIARLIADLDPKVPFTILAFFPAYQMRDNPSPTLDQVVKAYEAAREVVLGQVRVGNCGIFARTAEQWETLLEKVGAEGPG